MTDQHQLLIILQPNNIERKERTLFNAPINIRFYGACIACTLIDKLDRFTIQFWYSITLLSLTIFFFLHVASVGGSLLSIQ
uniref:Uncharacterized protein n=1 Tax=Meloidogyne hapla TaxID=6305 RepID=A0A1I8BX19_MELHA